MHRIGNQSDAQHKFKDDGRASHQERDIEAEEMIAVDINLELVHIDNLQHSGCDKDQSEQDLNHYGDNAKNLVHGKKKGTRVGMCLYWLTNVINTLYGILPRLYPQ